jgi:hypothetical protein
VLGTEEYTRLEFVQHASKTLRGHVYNTKLDVKALPEEDQSTLRVTATLSMEDTLGVDLSTSPEVEIAFVDFYRDMVLKRFLTNLLCTTDFDSL